MPPQNANAYYTPNGDEIVIPACPGYLNYGGIGVVIGHKITHAFDSSGRKYNGRGILDDWWTNETLAKFEGKNSMLHIVQYAKFIVADPANTALYVDGKLTLAGKLADNGVFDAALSVYRKLGKQEKSLPGFRAFIAGSIVLY
ncbi:hypothetical protein BD408DRAFT_429734 [Parasitella parasitica]|nr:hypothetical protein BD408DRAFT_429734 [Parasitella parasitica]